MFPSFAEELIKNLDPEKILNRVPKFFDVGNYPNPFNPSTTIFMDIPEQGNVTIQIFNSLGQIVHSKKLLANDAQRLKYNFTAKKLSSGLYFYRVRFKNQFKQGKMILLK